MKSRRFRTLDLTSPRTSAKASSKLGLLVGRSRLFPAVLGTRDRKGTAGKALRSVLRSSMSQPTRNAGADDVGSIGPTGGDARLSIAPEMGRYELVALRTKG
jgi:hypothetical protein